MTVSSLDGDKVLDRYVDVNVKWIMKSPASVPFATTLFVRDTCLCLHVQRAARALVRRYDDALRPMGLTSGQFSLLMSLNRPTPANMTQIATLLAMDRTTLTANLKPLERRDYIRVMISQSDRRQRVLIMTRLGQSVLAGAVPIWVATHQSIERLLGGSSPDRLRSDLMALS